MASSRADWLTKLFKVKYGPLAAFGIALWIAGGAILGNRLGYDWLPWVVLLAVSGFVLIEILTRLILRLGIGKHYYYWLYGYCLVDDDEYGFRFRPSLSVRDVEFSLFDRMAFPEGVKPPLDAAENRGQRLRLTANELGFRGASFNPESSGDKLRIFCVGGSTTACGFCDDADTWPARLEYYLGENGCAAEVINAGTIGWTSYQEYLLVKKELVNYRPHMILLHQGWNEEFLYSSLGLGKSWQPGMTRNVREAYSLYIAPNPLFSSTRSISLSLIFQHVFRNIIFAGNMSFENPERWAVLHEAAYIRAWFDNLSAIAKLARENGILAYTLDYPGLTNIYDLPQHRKIYVENSRLTRPYADYQAISKNRISNTLRQARGVIPCLRVEREFDHIVGSERMELFEDEIHLSSMGNDLFARTLANMLMEESSFRELAEQMTVELETFSSESEIAGIRSEVGLNPGYLTRLIDKYMYAARPEASGLRRLGRTTTSFDIPQTRYTTW